MGSASCTSIDANSKALIKRPDLIYGTRGGARFRNSSTGCKQPFGAVWVENRRANSWGRKQEGSGDEALGCAVVLQLASHPVQIPSNVIPAEALLWPPNDFPC